MRLDGVTFFLFALQMLMVQSVVADINRRTGESECQYYKDRLLYTEDGQRDELIDRSRTLSCHGELKNNRGLVSRLQKILYALSLLSIHFLPSFLRTSQILSVYCFIKSLNPKVSHCGLD